MRDVYEESDEYILLYVVHVKMCKSYYCMCMQHVCMCECEHVCILCCVRDVCDDSVRCVRCVHACVHATYMACDIIVNMHDFCAPRSHQVNQAGLNSLQASRLEFLEPRLAIAS